MDNSGTFVFTELQGILLQLRNVNTHIHFHSRKLCGTASCFSLSYSSLCPHLLPLVLNLCIFI